MMERTSGHTVLKHIPHQTQQKDAPLLADERGGRACILPNMQLAHGYEHSHPNMQPVPSPQFRPPASSTPPPLQRLSSNTQRTVRQISTTTCRIRSIACSMPSTTRRRATLWPARRFRYPSHLVQIGPRPRSIIDGTGPRALWASSGANERDRRTVSYISSQTLAANATGSSGRIPSTSSAWSYSRPA